MDFIIRAGERVGIVGRVGSGKTTIAKLIVKLFDVQQGVVYLDGIDISQIDPSEVRENVGTLPRTLGLSQAPLNKISLSVQRMSVEMT